MIERTSLRVKTDLAELQQVLAWFNQMYQPSIPKTVWFQCQTVLAEGFTNAVRHAHRAKPPETSIDIEISLSSQQLEIRIWDFGDPFDLQQTLEAIPETVEAEALGGRGLRLIDRIADHFTYTRAEPDRNCFLFIKYYSLSL